MKVLFCLRKAGPGQPLIYFISTLFCLPTTALVRAQAPTPTIVLAQSCTCKNNATTLQNGQFEDEITVVAHSDQQWSVVEAYGLYRADSPTPPIPPVPVSAGTYLEETPAGSGLYVLRGIHVDAAGYTLRVASNEGDTLSIANKCLYPEPALTGLNNIYCLYSDPVTLQGNYGDLSVVSATFAINGTTATQFDPQAGIGEYFISFSVDGGLPQGTDPGCVQTTGQFVNVISTPGALTCNDEVLISLDDDCVTPVLPDMILEGSYGCFDDYAVTIRNHLGIVIGDTVNNTHIGQTLLATITHLPGGNSCTGSIVVVDETAPTLVCTDILVNCAMPEKSPAYLKNTLHLENAFPVVVENCGSVQLTYIDNQIPVPCGSSALGHDDLTGYLERQWTATDASGNTASCLQHVLIRRVHVDEVIFPADTNLSCQLPDASPEWAGKPYFHDLDTIWALPVGSDFCDLSILLADDSVQFCSGSRIIARHWTVFDWCYPADSSQANNPASTDQTIRLMDRSAPEFICPDNLTISTHAFECCGTTDLPDIVLNDNCSPISTFSVRIDALDAETFDTLGVYQLDAPLTNFSGNNPWLIDTLGAPGSTPCLPPGIHTVTYLVSDHCGNTNSCAFALTVEDQVVPVAVCDEFTQVALDEDGIVYIEASTFDDGSYDNCSEIFFKAKRFGMNRCQPDSLYHDEVLFCCFDMKDTVSVILRVYEIPVPSGPVGPSFGTGNFIECSVKVLVEDKLKPVCTPPVDVTVSCENFDPGLGLYGFAKGEDNCRVDSVRVKNNYTQFDTVCNRGTIVRTFTVYDRAGQTSKCTQRVVVGYEQDYYLKFPDDVIVTVCNGAAEFGQPVLHGIDCEIPGISFTDEIFTVVPDACYQINRTWAIINWCTYNPNIPGIYVPNPNPNANSLHPSNRPGPIVSHWSTPSPWAPTVVKISPTDPAPTNYASFWQADANAFFYTQVVKVIESEDPIISNCPTSPVLFCDESDNSADFWNESYWWEEITGLHDLCEGPVDLSITATDACSGSNLHFKYLLFLDLDGDDAMETVVNSDNLPGANTVFYYNAGYQDFIGGEARSFDKRNVPTNHQYGFALQTTTTGNQITASVRWNTAAQPASFILPELPYGTHKIKWIVSDGCGNERSCEYAFSIQDCKKPGIVCINGLSVNMMQNGTIALWASDFLQYGSDNCTPANRLQYALEKSASSTGIFPLDANNQPQTSVEFNCMELGAQAVRLWALDLNGNADFCETYVIVQDNSGVCGTGSYLSVGGALKTEAENGLEEGIVALSGAHPAFPPLSLFDLSGSDGSYLFGNALPIASSYTLSPTCTDNPLNGVTTYDLVLLSKHILGTEQLDSPYKRIAADINKSGTITTYDVVELRKLILGVYNTFPLNTSWRFVDKNYSFPEPENPWAEDFPETKTVQQALTQQFGNDFVAIKTGDLNNTAIAGSFSAAPDRYRQPFFLDVQDRYVQKGERFEIPFFCSEKGICYQMTLLYAQLRLAGIRPGTTLDADHFAEFDHALTVSCEAAQQTPGMPEFTLMMEAQTNGWLSELLEISSRITPAEACDAAGKPADLSLRFGEKHIQSARAELFQNEPNPFKDKTTLSFFLPEAGEATLRITDVSGKTLWQQSGTFARGQHRILLTRDDIKVSGLVCCQLEYKGETRGRKMINVQ